MTTPGGEWVAVPIPGQPDRWDFVPAEQPPSPDGRPGTWHVVGGSGTEVGRWEWFPSAAPPPPPPPPPPASTMTWESATTTPASAQPAAATPPSTQQAAATPSWDQTAPPPPVGAIASGWQTPPPVLMATPPPKRSYKLPLAILAAVVALAAIGSVAAVTVSGGDDGKNKEEITALVNYVTTVEQGEDVCSSHLTEDFVRTVFGDLSTCENDDDDEPDDADATGATVTDIEIDDKIATAIVTVNGGDTDGATGTWGFLKGEDDIWRVSEWRADYLRSTFEKTFGEKYVSQGEDDPFADADVRGCVKDRIVSQDDAAFLDTAHELFRESDKSVEMLLGFMSDCPTDIEGVSALRALFEKGFRAKAELPSEEIGECIILGMRSQLSDEDIKELSLNRGAPAPPDVQERIQEITLDCAGSSTTFDPAPEEFDAPAPDLGT